MNPTQLAGDDQPQWAKLALRDQLQTARGRLSLIERRERADALARVVLAMPEVRRAATVAAYVAVGREPGTAPLLDSLAAAGKRILLPVLQHDLDLDWALHDGALVSAPRGLLEPEGPLLGLDAIAGADVVLVPGLAVDPTGTRLGKGGGSYDRALGRVPVGTLTCVLLHHEEVLAQLPRESHDRPVGAAATDRGVTRFVRGAG